MPPKSLTENGVFSGMFPAWRSPSVSDTSPAVVPNLISVEPMSEAPGPVPNSVATRLPCRQESSAPIDRGSSEGGATSEAVAVVEELGCVSEKAPCGLLLFIGASEGSLSVSDLLAVGGVVAVDVVGGGGGAVAVDAVVEGVGVCAIWWPLLLLLLWFLSLSSSAPSASLSSCWYMSSTMGFHNRTLALMNQFDTCRSDTFNPSTTLTHTHASSYYYYYYSIYCIMAG